MLRGKYQVRVDGYGYSELEVNLIGRFSSFDLIRYQLVLLLCTSSVQFKATSKCNYVLSVFLKETRLI